jgi:hypothetical protein
VADQRRCAARRRVLPERQPSRRAAGPPLLATDPHALARRSLRPCLTVIAPTGAEAVGCAGGWLFDQVMEGWAVSVAAADRGDRRPLDILGVRPCQLDAVFAASALGPCPQAIAVPADLYRADDRVRRLILGAAEAGGTEIRLWGDAWPADFDGGATTVPHRLSLAARAFKAQALAAAGLPRQRGDTELFRLPVGFTPGAAAGRHR